MKRNSPLGLVLVGFITGCGRPEPLTAPEGTNSRNAIHALSSGTTNSTILATAVLNPRSGSAVKGIVDFVKDGDLVRVEATLSGLTLGQHGFHIHSIGDCSASDGSSAGDHFKTTQKSHAGPGDNDRHIGDLGNIQADSDGNAKYSQVLPLKVDGPESIVGKAVIVHAKADDLKSQPAGGAGERIACGVIEAK